MSGQGRMISFNVGERTAEGYLIEPGEGRGLPGLIVIQEWWGLTDHIKDIAGRFADEGYVVLAPDLYDGKVTKDAEEAGLFMQRLSPEKAIETLNGAVTYLKSQDSVDPAKIGVTGFCMGGTYALLLACKNSDIKATAPFYGDVPSDEVLSQLSAPVLFQGAENDAWITPEKMSKLEHALKKYGKDGDVKIYPGVGHAFFNDTRPDAYDKGAAQEAWKSVLSFFEENLK